MDGDFRWRKFATRLCATAAAVRTEAISIRILIPS